MTCPHSLINGSSVCVSDRHVIESKDNSQTRYYINRLNDWPPLSFLRLCYIEGVLPPKPFSAEQHEPGTKGNGDSQLPVKHNFSSGSLYPRPHWLKLGDIAVNKNNAHSCPLGDYLLEEEAIKYNLKMT